MTGLGPRPWDGCLPQCQQVDVRTGMLYWQTGSAAINWSLYLSYKNFLNLLSPGIIKLMQLARPT